MSENQPDFTKPIDVKAFFYNKFGACGCSEIDLMINVIRDLLEWMDTPDHSFYNTLFNGSTGVYYILIGLFDNLGLCEHGIAIRYPWLTEKGRELLKALQTIAAEQIDKSEGKAYNGLYYSG